MNEAVIVTTARTAIAKAFRGALNNTAGVEFAAPVIRAALDKTQVDPASVDEVVFGCGYPEGATGGNIARQASIRAGLPVSVPGVTVSRFCASGLEAVAHAARRVILDGVHTVVAGGVEFDQPCQSPYEQNPPKGRVARRAQTVDLHADDRDGRYRR